MLQRLFGMFKRAASFYGIMFGLEVEKVTACPDGAVVMQGLQESDIRKRK